MIRTIFHQYDTPALSGEIELDDIYLGGRETNKHESKKTPNTQGRSIETKPSSSEWFRGMKYPCVEGEGHDK